MLKNICMLLVCATLLLNTTGCSVYMAANQPGLKNVELLRVGTSRDLLISEFGEPVSSGVDGDGREYDKFSFVQGYSTGAKAGRAILHVVADVLTHGLWEVLGTPLEATFDGDKITYEITYDRNDQVAQIIKFENVSSSIARANHRIISSLNGRLLPFKEMLKKVLVIIVLFSLSGCALHTQLVSFLRLDTHKINIKDSSGDFRAERTIIAEALKYCDALDKHFIPVEMKKSFLQNSYSLTFRCLDPGDPELTQQNQLENSIEKGDEGNDLLSMLLQE